MQFWLAAMGISDETPSNLNGLSSNEAINRQKIYGFNETKAKPYRLLILEAISHSTNPLILILLFAASVSGFTGNLLNSCIIIAMVIISVGLDYFQSHRSLTAMRKLQKRVAATAEVLRDSVWNEIPSRELVPGDLIKLSAGDLVPADAHVLNSNDLHVQEAALTGESLPVIKEAKPSEGGNETNKVFSGSSIVSGIALALVYGTGEHTEYGQIIHVLSKESPKTEFDRGLTRFGLFIMQTVFVLVTFVLAINVYLHRPLLESLLFSIALAVGLTPELLPMITTVTLAAGAMHMAKKKVIVKNLSAIQNLGSIDVLCSDKTGTLTSGEMALIKHIDPLGSDSEFVLLLSYLTSLFGTEIPSPFNTAVINKAKLNPMDAAILKHEQLDVHSYRKICEIPFDFERRRSSVVVDKLGSRLLITKGAPEFVVKDCTQYEVNGVLHTINASERQNIEARFMQLSEDGFRVLAVGYRKLSLQGAYSAKDEYDLVLLGFLAFVDPPLDDVMGVIQKLHKEGVTIKILTGDNQLVTQYVCKQVGMDVSRMLLGSELDHISDSALVELVEEIDVFARISPMQKQRIVSALRSRGHVVGYIGDGINDVPSLHSADVGISVAGAVDVAREAADIILLKRHLKVLLNGIMEGRRSFGNVMKYLLMGTSSNFGNMLSMAIGVLFLPFLPMLPTQILLNNLMYDISQVAIPTDNVDPSFTKKPKHWDINTIRKFMLYIGPISSIFDFITFYVMLTVFSASESLFQSGWFVESLATQTLVIFVIRTIKNPFQSKPSMPLTLMVSCVVLIAILLPFSPLAAVLGFVALPFSYFVFLVVATVMYLGLVEFLKRKLILKWL